MYDKYKIVRNRKAEKKTEIYKDDSDCKAASRAGIVKNFLISDTWYFYTMYRIMHWKTKRAFVYRIRRLQITKREPAYVYNVLFHLNKYISRTCRRNTHVKSSNLRKRWNWEIHRHIQSGSSICHDGEEVIQIGCDPKADSTMNLLGGEPLRPVMNYMREEDEEPEKLEDIAKEGFGNVLCIETGGPTPGLGCAGRGIIATFQLLEDLKLFETYKPDVVLYDVLGDVVCGGFAAPIREDYAEKVLIVTSGEKMALYAADNISKAVKNFEDRSYARVFGIVLNHRNVENENEK